MALLIQFYQTTNEIRYISVQRSLSFSRDVPGSSSVASKYRMPSTPKQPSALRRSSKSKIAKPQLPQNWVELVGETSLEKYSKEEIKRQEVCNQVCKITYSGIY